MPPGRISKLGCALRNMEIIVIRIIDLSVTGMSLSRRMILVPWSFWRCATAVVLVFGPTRDALVRIFDQKFLSKRYG